MSDVVRQTGSIMLADCGTALTKAVLLDRVAGQYRFIAKGETPTTTEYPWKDVTAGVQQAAEQISQATGREFFSKDGSLLRPETTEGHGLDVFSATTSASQPLQVVLAGLVRDLSVASLERAAAGTYSMINATLSSDAQGIGLTDEERVSAIRDTAPDVVCIAGGVDGGATAPVLDLAETAVLACSLMDESARPHILFAGNSRLRERMVQIVGGRTRLHVTDNVRPTLVGENLSGAQRELDALYLQHKMGTLPGVAGLARWSTAPLIPSARAFSQLVQYLWHLGEPPGGVLGIDVGAASTSVAAVFDGYPFLTVLGDVGIAFGGEQMLRRNGSLALLRWVPEPMTEDQALGLLINKALRPVSIAQDLRELWLEQALAREAIRAALRVAQPGWATASSRPDSRLMQPCDTIVISGGALARAPLPGQTALIVLDAVEPIGITTLVMDPYCLAPALGGVTGVRPLAVVEALDNGILVNLATAVTPVGHAHRGDIVLNVTVTYDDGSTLHVEVQYGDLEVLPLPPGQQATVELIPARDFDVGLGGPGKSGKRRVSGGLVGLVIDARGRPLRLPDNAELRHEQMHQWRWNIGA